MLRISDATNLAFHAMLLLASDQGRIQFSVQELAQRMGVSDNHLSKVMQRLAKAGLVASKRGPKGGFYLAKPAAEIRLLDIYEINEGALSQETCLLDKPICDGSCCLLGHLVRDLRQKVLDHLTRNTLRDASAHLPCGSLFTAHGPGS